MATSRGGDRHLDSRGDGRPDSLVDGRLDGGAAGNPGGDRGSPPNVHGGGGRNAGGRRSAAPGGNLPASRGDGPAQGNRRGDGVDVSIMIGGDAGQGVESSGAGFTKALARAGLEVFSVSDYRSRIRGGHNFYQIRAATRPVYCHSDPVHLLLALTPESVDVHLDNLAAGAGIVYDETFEVDAAPIERRGARAFPLPLAALAEAQGSRVMMNTAALGAAAGILGLERGHLESVIRDNFSGKGPAVVDGNLHVLRSAYDRAAQAYGEGFRHRVGARPAVRTGGRAAAPPQTRTGSRRTAKDGRLVLHGNHAFALGAIAGGCRFISAYPMTPGTSLFEYMTAHAGEVGIVSKHAEDEIAAICMSVGAAQAGARAMVTTSGGGFSLMVEALGMAGMCEIPIVVYIAQRGGPSTGLPTRTEQGDLLFAIHASQGEFPRIVLAPGTIHEAYEMGWRSFNLAERFQCPVIVLSDQFLAGSLRAIPSEAFSLEQVVIDRGDTLTSAQLDGLTEPYRRYALTPSGISPRAVPGHPGAVYAICTDEHSEDGHITEDVEMRVRMMRKRMRKLDAAAREMRPPSWTGPAEADLTLIAWGSLYGAASESLEILRRDGVAANLLHFSDLWPLPAGAVRAELAKIRGRAVSVEQNYTHQLARLLRMATGFTVHHHVSRYDGRPYSPQDIALALRAIAAGGGDAGGAVETVDALHAWGAAEATDDRDAHHAPDAPQAVGAAEATGDRDAVRAWGAVEATGDGDAHHAGGAVEAPDARDAHHAPDAPDPLQPAGAVETVDALHAWGAVEATDDRDAHHAPDAPQAAGALEATGARDAPERRAPKPEVPPRG